MIRSIHLLAIALLAGSAVSQSTFQLAFGPPVTSGAYVLTRAVRHTDDSWTVRAGSMTARTMLHLNPQGEAQWNLTYNSSDLMTYSHIACTAPGPANSTILLFGDTVHEIGGGQSRRHFGLARIGSSGQVIWSRRYSYYLPVTIPYPSSPHALAVAADGRIFAHTGEPSLSGIMCFLANGDPLWASGLSDPAGVVGGFTLVADEAGGCFYLNGQDQVDTNSVMVGHLDGEGALIWNRRYRSAVSGRTLYPQHMSRTMEGGLLITAAEFDPSVGLITLLIRLSGTGDELWTNTYWSDANGPLTPFRAVERPDGGAWVLVDRFGYGFLGTNAQGEVEQAVRYTYREVGNITHVVQIFELFVHQNELCAVANYVMDHTWPGQDQVTYLLWKLDAAEPVLCGAEPFTVTRIPGADLATTTNTTAADFTISELPFALGSITATDIPTQPFCDLYVGVEAHAGVPAFSLAPSVIERGGSCTVTSTEHATLELVDGTGKLVRGGVQLLPGAPLTMTTAGYALGLYLIRAVGPDGRVLGAIRLLIQ